MPKEINRRTFFNLSGATALAGVSSLSAAAQAPNSESPSRNTASTKQHNIIIFMPDEMRADALACYGNPITKTPNFDKLAAEGARFDDCHVQFPVCGASRCAMLTGWPTSVRGHRSLYYFLRPEEPNLFRYLRQSGYDVFWFGKNDALAAQSFYDSVTRWGDQPTPASGRGRMENLTPGSVSMLFSPGGDRRDTTDYLNVQSAIDILKRKESDRPFCIFLPLIQPHPPYTAPADFYNMYSPDQVPTLAKIDLPKKPDFHKSIRQTYGLDKLAERNFRQIKAVYYGQTSYSDWVLGQLLEAIESTGHRNDTAILVTSDHGDYAGDYGLVEKWPSALEDCLTRVPMIARVPGGKPGVVDQNMIEMFDVMQTSLDLAHIPNQATHTHFSRSLMPQIMGGGGDPNRAAFAEGGYNVYEPQCFEPLGSASGMYGGKLKLQNENPVTVSRSAMIRTKTHKLILRPQGQSELYDIKRDPLEEHNLYGDSSVASIHLDLQTRLLNRYINTTGIAPMDKDQRDAPPYYPTTEKSSSTQWQSTILDR